ncbi:hypothetical protein J5V16_17830 [Glycomyces sp. NEAU-S30]|uniref:Uncharacterized protein n=1 Tax=Glycomyces niveus TaxID=2820287 RepID=A0ABS3U7E1_9ACTN|nr:hypothetical protein [Glycomyces sp. NEAU-S30]
MIRTLKSRLSGRRRTSSPVMRTLKSRLSGSAPVIRTL